MMWALKVTRSTMAATSLGSGKTVPHSGNGRLVAMAMEGAFFAFGDDLEAPATSGHHRQSCGSQI